MSPVAAFKRSSDSCDELEVVFHEHYRMVYGAAYSVTGSHQEAEDVLQTLFLRLLRSGFPPDFRKNPKAYLYRATVNQALNAVRSQRRRKEVLDPATLERAVDVPTEEPIDQLDLQKRVVKAMAQLNRRAVEMVILRYQQEYSEAEIAKLFGTSRSVVAVTLWRARARLRSLLSVSDGDRRLPSSKD